jgi:hypothetical protein
MSFLMGIRGILSSVRKRAESGNSGKLERFPGLRLRREPVDLPPVLRIPAGQDITDGSSESSQILHPGIVRRIIQRRDRQKIALLDHPVRELDPQLHLDLLHRLLAGEIVQLVRIRP